MEVSTDSSPDPIKTTIIDEKTKGTIYKRLCTKQDKVIPFNHATHIP